MDLARRVVYLLGGLARRLRTGFLDGFGPFGAGIMALLARTGTGDRAALHELPLAPSGTETKSG